MSKPKNIKYDTETKTSATEWNRIYAKRGLIAAIVFAWVFFLVCVCIAFPVVLVIAVVIGSISAVGFYYYLALTRDLNFSGDD